MNTNFRIVKMKNLVVLSLLTVFALGKAVAQDSYGLTEVIQVENVSQKELYGRAKLWFINAFKSSKDVIQSEDAEQGMIVGKALFSYKPRNIMMGDVAGTVNYAVKVFVKDGRYKYDITDFRHEKCGMITTDEDCPCKFALTKGMNNKIWNDVKENCKKEAESLINDLKKKMSKKSEADF
jgi:hypothetical protein